MAVKQIGGNRDYDTKEFVISSTSDIADLPTDIGWGSIALCIDDGTLYILTSEKEWTVFNSNN